MGSSFFTHAGGVSQQGEPGSYEYATLEFRANYPVAWASFWDAIRFANWLHNGQPSGPQGPETTEDGAYTITPEGIANNTITRNPDARVFIPSFDEWLKAGYYKGGGTDAGYWQFPYQSDEQTVPGRPPGEPNTANISGVFLGAIEVGAFTASVGPYGTFDQGGNVWEWSETIIDSPVTFDPILRGLHGGGWAGEQREVLSIIPNFGCDLIVFGDLGLVRYGVAQFHIV